MLSKLFAPASHRKHTTDLVNWVVSKNMIGVMDVHGCVSVSMSVSNLVDTVCGYMMANITKSKSANCENTSGFLIFSVGSYSKRGIALTIDAMCLWLSL